MSRSVYGSQSQAQYEGQVAQAQGTAQTGAGGRTVVNLRRMENGRTGIKFPYDAGVVQRTKQLHGSTWDSSTKTWSVALPLEEVAIYFKECGLTIVTPEDMCKALAGREVLIDKLEDGRLTLSFDYNEVMVKYVKELPRRAWDKDTQLWTVEGMAESEVVAYFQAVGVKVRRKGDIMPMVARVAEKVPKLSDAEVDRRLAKIPEDIQCRLYMFQQEGVRFGIKHGGRLILADEMGLGKTVQAICILAAFSEDWPLLVVCPSSLRLVWEEAVQDWLPPSLLPTPDNIYTIMSGQMCGVPVLWQQAVDIDKKLPARMPQRSITIISYALAAKLGEQRLRQFTSIICDESHSLKDQTTNRTRIIRPAVAASRRAILISGTPISANAMQMYTQIDMVRPRLLGSRDDYGRRYGGGQKVMIANGMWDYRGSSNIQELHAILAATLYIRRLKKDVLQELPDKQRRRILVETDNRKKLERIKAELDANERDHSITEEQRRRLSNQLVNQWWRETGVAKIKEAIKHLECLVEGGNKVLMFAHHSIIMDDFDGALKKKGTKFVRIDGSTSAKNRQEAVRKFQDQKGVKVALLSITAAGTGLTLTEANVVMFGELHWTPAWLIQCEDRAHRVGQHAALQVHYVVGGEGTADPMMWQKLQKNLGMAGRVLDGHGTGSAAGLRITPGAYATPVRATSPSAWVPTPEGPPQKRARLSPSTPFGAGSQIPETSQHARAVRVQPSASQRGSEARQAAAEAAVRRAGAATQSVETGKAAGISSPRKLKQLYPGFEEAATQLIKQPQTAQPGPRAFKLPPAHSAFGQAGTQPFQPGPRTFALDPATPSTSSRPEEASQTARLSQQASAVPPAAPARRLPGSFLDGMQAGPLSQDWLSDAGSYGRMVREQEATVLLQESQETELSTQPAEGVGSGSRGRAARRLSYGDAAMQKSQESQEEVIDLTQEPYEPAANKRHLSDRGVIATGVFAEDDDDSDSLEIIG